MDYDKLTELCRERAKAETDIERSWEDRGGPDEYAYYELCRERCEAINKCLDIEEHKVIISNYRGMLGNICCRLETSQDDCRERCDEIKALKGILDEQKDLKWRDHKLFEEHKVKRRAGYFDKEENK